MKFIIGIIVLVFHSGLLAQQGYPVPDIKKNHLFYIQHSNNHNTYVYEANTVAEKQLNISNPVNVFRIDYRKGGEKEELNVMQRKLAYGVVLVKTSASSCEFTLAAYPQKIVYLHFYTSGIPYASVNVNGKNLVLHKLFLSCNKMGTTVNYIDFYGKDIATGKEIKERLYIKK